MWQVGMGPCSRLWSSRLRDCRAEEHGGGTPTLDSLERGSGRQKLWQVSGVRANV